MQQKKKRAIASFLFSAAAEITADRGWWAAWCNLGNCKFAGGGAPSPTVTWI